MEKLGSTIGNIFLPLTSVENIVATSRVFCTGSVKLSMNNIVTVPWQNQSNVWWNQTCADIMEVFGLPGGRYQTEVSSKAMVFHFKNEKDAFMCRIMISDQL
jgi:hypothetical protein